jgi:predicted dehydrogenase
MEHEGETSAPSGATTGSVGFGVIGIEHLHVFELVDGLVSAGCRAVAHVADPGPLPDAYAAWQGESRPTDVDDLLADPAVDLVVLAGVPSERAAAAQAALIAGKDVLSDKPGVTSRAQLDELRKVVDATGRRWWVLYSERFGSPAVMEAVRLARSGRVGPVVHVQGSAPHRGSLELRPPWFFDRDRVGGILVDLGSHQVDQFLAVTGATAADVRVVEAAAGNVRAPGHPGLEDVGEMLLAVPGTRGHHRVDYLEADGFPTWGDVRLVVTGTEGRIDVRLPVADDGTAGPAAVWVTDADGVHRLEHAPEVTWPTDLLADLASGGERLMTRRHPFDVSELTLRAAEAAEPWGPARGER